MATSTLKRDCIAPHIRLRDEYAAARRVTAADVRPPSGVEGLDATLAAKRLPYSTPAAFLARPSRAPAIMEMISSLPVMAWAAAIWAGAR